MDAIEDIRVTFKDKLENEDFVIDKLGSKTIEIIGCTFIADEPSIFGAVNDDYIKREIEWYNSLSRYVEDIPGNTPEIWKQVSSNTGMINSNYGWCIFSEENGFQYINVLNEMVDNPYTRRAEMIYTRPTMWSDYKQDGMSDFMCTDSHQYFIRDNKMHVHVRMRSNDAYFGYRNDWAWADYVLENLIEDYNQASVEDVQKGDIIWTVGSIHLYERHFHMVV